MYILGRQHLNTVAAAPSREGHRSSGRNSRNQGQIDEDGASLRVVKHCPLQEISHNDAEGAFIRLALPSKVKGLRASS
jgi:hypothetical protein